MSMVRLYSIRLQPRVDGKVRGELGFGTKEAAMTACKLGFAGLMLCFQLVFIPAASAQLSEAAKSAVLISTDYEVLPDITYGIANNYELKLDVYRPTNAKAPTPVVMMIHGGGWVRHQKEEEVLSLLPYLEMGWAAVNLPNENRIKNCQGPYNSNIFKHNELQESLAQRICLGPRRTASGNLRHEPSVQTKANCGWQENKKW